MTGEAEQPTVEAVIDQLAARRTDAVATLELLEQQRAQVEADRSLLENPGAILDYIAFFTRFIGDTVEECARLASELSGGVQPGQVDALRQLASNSAAEQRRCLMFRDRWINKPLPHERVRPLLNDISITTRDQLTAFRDLNTAAGRLEALLPKPAEPPDPGKAMGRRALFTRIFKP